MVPLLLNATPAAAVIWSVASTLSLLSKSYFYSSFIPNKFILAVGCLLAFGCKILSSLAAYDRNFVDSLFPKVSTLANDYELTLV